MADMLSMMLGNFQGGSSPFVNHLRSFWQQRGQGGEGGGGASPTPMPSSGGSTTGLAGYNPGGSQFLTSALKNIGPQITSQVNASLNRGL